MYLDEDQMLSMTLHANIDYPIETLYNTNMLVFEILDTMAYHGQAIRRVLRDTVPVAQFNGSTACFCVLWPGKILWKHSRISFSLAPPCLQKSI